MVTIHTNTRTQSRFFNKQDMTNSIVLYTKEGHKSYPVNTFVFSILVSL